MKFSILSLLVAFGLLHSFPALADYDPCLTPAESRQSYRNCMNFLNLSPNQQQVAARRAGSTRDQGLATCLYQKRKGLAGMLAAEREYCRAINTRESSTPSRVNSCSSNYDCVSGQHCLDSRCEDASRVKCKNAHSCSSGSYCVEGECK